VAGLLCGRSCGSCAADGGRLWSHQLRHRRLRRLVVASAFAASFCSQGFFEAGSLIMAQDSTALFTGFVVVVDRVPALGEWRMRRMISRWSKSYAPLGGSLRPSKTSLPDASSRCTFLTSFRMPGAPTPESRRKYISAKPSTSTHAPLLLHALKTTPKIKSDS
jgi:hypothetical protein